MNSYLNGAVDAYFPKVKITFCGIVENFEKSRMQLFRAVKQITMQ